MGLNQRRQVRTGQFPNLVTGEWERGIMCRVCGTWACVNETTRWPCDVLEYHRCAANRREVLP